MQTQCFDVKIATEKLKRYTVQSLTVPMYTKGDKNPCSNYQGTLLLSNTHKILLNILLSWLTPSVDKIIWDYQRGLQ